MLGNLPAEPPHDELCNARWASAAGSTADRSACRPAQRCEVRTSGRRGDSSDDSRLRTPEGDRFLAREEVGRSALGTWRRLATVRRRSRPLKAPTQVTASTAGTTGLEPAAPKTDRSPQRGGSGGSAPSADMTSAPGPRFLRTRGTWVLVGDTGIEPVTSSVSTRSGTDHDMGISLFHLLVALVGLGLALCRRVRISRSSPRFLPRGGLRRVQPFPSSAGGSPRRSSRGGGRAEGPASAASRAESRRGNDLPREYPSGQLFRRGAGLPDFCTKGLRGFPSRGRSPIGPCRRWQATLHRLPPAARSDCLRRVMGSLFPERPRRRLISGCRVGDPARRRHPRPSR